jgi:hypothetical protein
VTAEGFDTLESRAQEGHALYLRGRVSGRLFRFSPVRDPAQPRLWCLLVERCETPGIAGRRSEAVIGPGGLTREEAQIALRELGANPTKWLGQPRHRRLQSWLRGDVAVGGDATAPPPSLPPRGDVT